MAPGRGVQTLSFGLGWRHHRFKGGGGAGVAWPWARAGLIPADSRPWAFQPTSCKSWHNYFFCCCCCCWCVEVKFHGSSRTAQGIVNRGVECKRFWRHSHGVPEKDGITARVTALIFHRTWRYYALQKPFFFFFFFLAWIICKPKPRLVLPMTFFLQSPIGQLR